MDRLKALGAWLEQNGEGIYATHPWKRAEGETGDGLRIRFTAKDDAVYAFVLGEPKGHTVTIRDLQMKDGAAVTVLGESGELRWKQVGADVQVTLPGKLAGKYAYGVKMVGME